MTTAIFSNKLEASQALIERVLRAYRRPAVLWSGGKDSMVLLHMLRAVAPQPLPVICWREPWMPWKQEFVNAMIERWSLTVWDWHPQRVSLCKGNGRIDVLNCYQWGPTGQSLALARGTNPPAEGEPWLCGRDTFLSRPVAPFVGPWDVAFHGHKSVDKDATSGAVPLQVDILDTPGAIACAYPLRHFTDDDIFAYIEEYEVPYDRERYRRNEDGTWQILPYQWRNPDYYPACMKCLDPAEGEWVACPKLEGAQINNISAQVRWENPVMPYCNLRTTPAK